jgi:hypothetical protein
LLMPTSKHLTHGISNLVSLITKTKLGLSTRWWSDGTPCRHLTLSQAHPTQILSEEIRVGVWLRGTGSGNTIALREAMTVVALGFSVAWRRVPDESVDIDAALPQVGRARGHRRSGAWAGGGPCRSRGQET